LIQAALVWDEMVNPAMNWWRNRASKAEAKRSGFAVRRMSGANAPSDLSLITRDIDTNYIPNDRSSRALSHETIRQQIGQCLAKLPK